MSVQQGKVTTKKIRGNLFASLSGIGLILIILAIALYLPCPSNSQYLIFRIVLAIAIAGFASVITGFFNFEYQKIITAGGALAVFAFAYMFTPSLINTTDKCTESFDFTIFLEDSTGNIPLKNTGSLRLKIGSDMRSDNIDDKGSSSFKEIPSAYKDSVVVIQLECPGWQFASQKTNMPIQLKKRSFTATIQRDNSLCCITGKVRDHDKFILGAKVSIGNIVEYTNNEGWFSLTIPPEKQKEEYILAVDKEGYTIWENSVRPGTGQEVGVVLQRKQK